MPHDSLQNQNALIIGGGTGIGQATAVGLARSGCRTAVAGRRVERLAATSRAYSGSGEILGHEADVTSRQSLGDLVEWFHETIGPIDILVNAAGTNIKNRSMSAMRPEQWDEVMAVNATGAYNCLSAVLPQMRERQQGTIVQISSIAGKRALELGGIAYCASKFAMTALGTAVGQEEAPHGIRITNVYPGEVDTPLLDLRPQPATHEHRSRMLQPQDVADVVVTICSLPPRVHIPEIVIKPRWQRYL